jgi:hypothetical protein
MTQFGHRIGAWHPLQPVLVAEVQYDHFHREQVQARREVSTVAIGQER